MHAAVDEQSKQETFRGYGPEQGYDSLKESIQAYYAMRDTKLELDEIFVSDGAKSDVGNILDLFDKDNTVLVPDPVYPVYVDTNVMGGPQNRVHERKRVQRLPAAAGPVRQGWHRLPAAPRTTRPALPTTAQA